jgi:hypothetical protein
MNHLLYTSLTPSLFIEVPELSQKGLFICVLGVSNLHISTIFLLNAGTVPTMWYIFFSFYYRLWKKPSRVAIFKKKYGCDPSSVIEFVKMKYSPIDIKWWPQFKYTLTFFHTLHHVHNLLLQQYFTQMYIFFTCSS